MHTVEAKTILSQKNGMNPYRGCTHGCIYCDSRSECYGMTYAFEDVAIKVNAPQLLQEALHKKRQRCMIGTGAMSDPYLPLEKEIKLTRRCLEIIDDFGFGATLITKSDLVLRDLDLLKSINNKSKCVVQMTLTTFDEDLCKIVEPNVATTHRRFEVLMELKKAGIPTVVWITPILPLINDSIENMQGILGYCKQAEVKGIITFGIGMTLRSGNREYYYKKLDEHFPGIKREYMHTFKNSYGLKSKNDRALNKMVKDFCKENSVLYDAEIVFDYLMNFDKKQEQLSFL